MQAAYTACIASFGPGGDTHADEPAIDSTMQTAYGNLPNGLCGGTKGVVPTRDSSGVVIGFEFALHCDGAGLTDGELPAPLRQLLLEVAADLAKLRLPMNMLYAHQGASGYGRFNGFPAWLDPSVVPHLQELWLCSSAGSLAWVTPFQTSATLPYSWRLWAQMRVFVLRDFNGLGGTGIHQAYAEAWANIQPV